MATTSSKRSLVIPGLNGPLGATEMSAACKMYNNNDHISVTPEIDEAHVWALLDVIKRLGLQENFCVHRIHRHDAIPEDTVKMEQSLDITDGKWNRAIRVKDLDFSNMHATVFKFVEGQAAAYEFAEGPSPLPSNIKTLVGDLNEEFSLYLETHGLCNHLALEYGDFSDKEVEPLTEVDFDGVGTIALPQSRVSGGAKIITSWIVPPANHFPDKPPPGQTWSPMVNASHKVFQNSLGGQPKVTSPEQVIEELVSQGIVDKI